MANIQDIANPSAPTTPPLRQLKNLKQYIELALITKSPGLMRMVRDADGEVVIDDATGKPKKECWAQGMHIDLYHGIIGSVSELGEFLSPFKSCMMYGNSFNRTNANEETGDIWWFVSIILDVANEALINYPGYQLDPDTALEHRQYLRVLDIPTEYGKMRATAEAGSRLVRHLLNWELDTLDVSRLPVIPNHADSKWDAHALYSRALNLLNMMVQFHGSVACLLAAERAPAGEKPTAEQVQALMFESLAKNIQKLELRYKGGSFDANRAIYRTEIAAEQQVLAI